MSALVDPFTCEPLSGVSGSPVIPIHGYEASVINDPARLIAWVKSRQIGGSFTTTLKVSLDAVEHGENWNMMSRSQRQAEKLLLKAANHVLAMNRYTTQVLGRPPIVDPAKIGSQRITLINGAVIEAVPCDPDTTTGDTVNWLLDEFGLFPKSQRVFGVIKPSIMRGKKMIVVSSPRGRRGKFFELWQMFEQMGRNCGWSWHKTTIEDAIRDGFCPLDEAGRPMTFEQFKAAEVRDIGMDLFLQEYMCVFSDKLIAFLPYKIIVASSAANLPLVRTVDALRDLRRDLYVGVDIGRRHDLTVIWVLARSGDQHQTLSVFALENCPFAEQDRVLRSILATGMVAGCCIDEQGIGMQLAESMTQSFPGVVVPCSFTNPFKAEISHRLKILMEGGNFFMPDDPDLRDDFASIERDVTDTGLVRIAAPRSGRGHGDRFWAAALACHSASIHKPFELAMAC